MDIKFNLEQAEAMSLEELEEQRTILRNKVIEIDLIVARIEQIENDPNLNFQQKENLLSEFILD